MIVDPLPCRTLVEQATDWLEGDVTPEHRMEIELHLVTCAGCLAYVGQLRQTRQALSRLGEAHLGDDESPPPDEVRADLLSRFRRRTGSGA